MISRSAGSPVVAAGSRLLIAPGVFLQESIAQLPHVGPRLQDLDGRGSPDMPAGAQASAKIDCIIFADGEIVGPNQTHYDAEIQSRKIAAEQLAKQIRYALARGDDPKVTLSNIVQTTPAQSDFVALWTLQYARLLQRVPAIEKFLPSLENSLEPPNFYKR